MSIESSDVRAGWSSAPLIPRVLGWAVWLLPLHALLLLWGTWNRQPSPSTEFADWARFVSTDEFRWSHLVASIGGQTVGMIGTAALTALMVARGASIGRGAVGLFMFLTGSGLMLTGFGIAAFAQPAVGQLHQSQPGLAEEMYHALYSPSAFVVLLTGLALFSFSTLPTGSALASLLDVPRWAARLYTVAGPVFGVVGFLLDPFQTLGALALAVASAVAAIHLTVGRGR
jgi:hypothetical protein